MRPIANHQICGGYESAGLGSMGLAVFDYSMVRRPEADALGCPSGEMCVKIRTLPYQPEQFRLRFSTLTQRIGENRQAADLEEKLAQDKATTG